VTSFPQVNAQRWLCENRRYCGTSIGRSGAASTDALAPHENLQLLAVRRQSVL